MARVTFTARYARDHAALGAASREAAVSLGAVRVLMAISDQGGHATRPQLTDTMGAAREQVGRSLTVLRDAGLAEVWVANDGPMRRQMTHAELTPAGHAIAERVNEAAKEQP